MKFGKRMQECLFYPWAEHYLRYNSLKQALKKATRGPQFLLLLKSELQRIEAFFRSKERELSQQLHAFETRGILSGDVHFVDFCSNLDHLREYVLVNYLAVRKIVKKHDKLCTSECHPVASDAARMLSKCTVRSLPTAV